MKSKKGQATFDLDGPTVSLAELRRRAKLLLRKLERNENGPLEHPAGRRTVDRGAPRRE